MITFELIQPSTPKKVWPVTTYTPAEVPAEYKRWEQPQGLIITTQTAYDAWLDDIKINIGDIITMSYTQAASTAALYVIAYIERSFDKVGSVNGVPRPFLVVQVGRYNGRRSVRWDNHYATRRATEQEIKTLIGSDTDYDQIRADCIAEGKEHLSRVGHQINHA